MRQHPVRVELGEHDARERDLHRREPVARGGNGVGEYLGGGDGDEELSARSSVLERATSWTF